MTAGLPEGRRWGPLDVAYFSGETSCWVLILVFTHHLYQASIRWYAADDLLLVTCFDLPLSVLVFEKSELASSIVYRNGLDLIK